MEKTFGGARLGSGKQMTVDLHNYGRSTHNLSKVVKTTMSCGTLLPIGVYVALPGDTWDMELDAAIMTHPTLGPLFDGHKIQVDIFEAPMRLYQSRLMINELEVGLHMETVKIPTITLIAYANNGAEKPKATNQINSSCLLAYLGMRGVGSNNTPEKVLRDFNGFSYLAYWDIVKNYYANKQEGIGAVIHSDTPALVTTVDEIQNQAGVVIPVLPDTDVVQGGTYLKVFYTGIMPNVNQIMMNTTDGQRLSLTQIMGGEYQTIIGSPMIIPIDVNRYGQLEFSSWSYRENWEPYVRVPRVETFNLTNIDDMRKKVLRHMYDTVPFNINTAAAELGAVLRNELTKAGIDKTLMDTQVSRQQILNMMSDIEQKWQGLRIDEQKMYIQRYIAQITGKQMNVTTLTDAVRAITGLLGKPGTVINQNPNILLHP